MTSAKRIGLMGCGAVAGYGHLPAILETPALELHAIFDPSESNLRATQARFGVPHAFTEAEKFFACGLDAVTITSPAPCHRENVLDCARHRLPALCEKPLAMNGDDAREMIRAMREAGVSLYPGFCYRFSPAARKIRELVSAGAVGKVCGLRLIYKWNAHGKYESAPEGGRRIKQRRADRMLEGGPMVDCGTHQIDLALYWLRSPVVRFSGHGAWVDEYVAPDHMWLHLDHACGAHTVVEISYSFGHTSQNPYAEFVYELIGTHGVVRYDRERQVFFLENEAGRQDFPFSPEKEFQGMYQEWAWALQEGHSDALTSAEDGLRVAEIARLATEEVIRGRTPPSPKRAGAV